MMIQGVQITETEQSTADLARQLVASMEKAWLTPEADDPTNEAVKEVMNICTKIGERFGGKLPIGELPITTATLYLLALLATQ